MFVAVYDVTDEDVSQLDDWESVATGSTCKTRVRIATMLGEQLAWTYVLDAYEGGVPSASLPRDPRRRRRGRRRPGRLRRRAAPAPVPLQRALSLPYAAPDDRDLPPPAADSPTDLARAAAERLRELTGVERTTSPW